MPEHDDGEQLRREFLRQAPGFDLGTTLPHKVSTLVRRRQRRRRIVPVVIAVAVVAAVAIPFSALRSSPVGRQKQPGPATKVPTTASSLPPTTTPTTAVAGPALSCDTLDLWTTAPGTVVTTTAALAGVTVTMTGTATSVAGGDTALTGAQLTVSMDAHHFSEAVTPPAGTSMVIPWSLAPLPAGSSSPTSDALCLARFPDQSLPTVLLGLDTGGAHCCTVVRALPISSTGLAPAVDDNVGNPAVALESDGDDAMIVTADNAFAYQFSSYALSGLPLKLEQFTPGRFVDITSQRPDLLTADAAMWWRNFTNSPDNGLGLLAPWVADECRLGQSTSAWATVQQLLAQGKLVGPAGWPSGAAYVQALHTFLSGHGYC
jgi:hypothetical protein